MLFLSSLVLAYALSAVMNYNSETAARGNFTLRLALSSQVALAEQEAVKVKSMMKATAEAEATKRSEKWLTHILAGVASPMVIISQSGSVRVREHQRTQGGVGGSCVSVRWRLSCAGREQAGRAAVWVESQPTAPP